MPSQPLCFHHYCEHGTVIKHTDFILLRNISCIQSGVEINITNNHVPTISSVISYHLAIVMGCVPLAKFLC